MSGLSWTLSWVYSQPAGERAIVNGVGVIGTSPVSHKVYAVLVGASFWTITGGPLAVEITAPMRCQRGCCSTFGIRRGRRLRCQHNEIRSNLYEFRMVEKAQRPAN